MLISLSSNTAAGSALGACRQELVCQSGWKSWASTCPGLTWGEPVVGPASGQGPSWVGPGILVHHSGPCSSTFHPPLANASHLVWGLSREKDESRAVPR